MNWSNFAEVRKLERETRKGLMTFEGIGVVKLQLEYFDDILSVNQVKLLPDCTSLLSGSRLFVRKIVICLFELARILKIFG